MRLDVIDIIKAISILMIVNVHLLSGELFAIGSTYHVIAFFFITGIIQNLHNKKQVIDFWQFIKSRTKRLLYPYFTLSLCYLLMHMVLNVIRGEELINQVIIDSFIKCVTFRGIGTLWFLPVLFIAEVLFFSTRKRIKIIVPIIAGILTIYLSSRLYLLGFFSYQEVTTKVILLVNPVSIILSSIIATFFMYVGEITSKIVPNVFINPNSLSRKYNLIILITCVVSFAMDYLLSKDYSGDLHKLNINNVFVYIACSLLGLSFVTTISIIIVRYFNRLTRLLLSWGKNSLIIMTTHTEYYLNSIAYAIVIGVSSCFHLSLENRIVSLLSLTLIMIMETVLIPIINNTKLRILYKYPQTPDNI